MGTPVLPDPASFLPRQARQDTITPSGVVLPDPTSFVPTSVTPARLEDIDVREVLSNLSLRAKESQPDVTLARPEQIADQFDAIMTAIEEARARGEPLDEPEFNVIRARDVGFLERRFGKIGREVGGGLDIAKHALFSPIETLKGMITAPFIITGNAFREIATRSDLLSGVMSRLVEMGIEDPEDILGPGATIQDATEENVRKFLISKYGEMTPREAAEARRAFSALSLSFAAAPAGAGLGLRISQAAGLGARSTSLIAGTTGASAAGVTLGFVEATPEDRLKMTIGYGLIAAPFGIAHAALGIPFAEINKIRSGNFATDAGVTGARIRMSRALDEVPEAIALESRLASIRERAEPLVREIVTQEQIGQVQRIQELFKTDPQRAFTELANLPPEVRAKVSQARQTISEAVEETRPRDFKTRLEDGEGRADFTNEQMLQAEKGVVPPISETASKVTENLINSDLNTIHAIIRTHRDLKPDGVTVIPGAETPAEAIRVANQLMPGTHILSTYKRPDGLFDIAIGGRQSALKGSQSQFSQQGFYEGQAVVVDGTFYHYASKQGNKAILRVPGSDKRVQVDFSRLRRAPYINEMPVRESNVETVLAELKDVLSDEPGAFEAISKMYEKNKPDITAGVDIPKPDIDVIAASNNMKVERGAPGTFKVIDQETGRTLIRGLRSKGEAEKFINDNMQNVGVESIGSSNGPTDIPISTINDITGPPTGGDISGPSGGYGVPFTAAPRWHGLDVLREMFDGKFRRITSRRDQFAAMDGRYPGLQSEPEFWLPPQDGINRARGNLNPVLDRLSKEVDPLLKGLSQERREFVLDAIEAFSEPELRSFLKPEEVAFAERLAGLNVDLARIYGFRRELSGLLDMISKKEGIKVSDIPAEIRAGLREELIERSKLTKEEIAADRIFSQVVPRDMFEVDLFNVARLHDAIADRAMSRSELFDFHKFSGKERLAVQNLEKLFKVVADILEIPDWRRIPGYVSHARKYGAVDASNAFEQRAPTGSSFEFAQNLTAEMIRSGEISDYIRDPIANFVHYAASSMNFKFFVREWNRVANTAKERINSLEVDRFGNQVTEADRIFMRQNIDDYLNDTRGFRNEAEKAFDGYLTEFANNSGLKLGKEQKLDIVNLYLSVNSGAALGFRVGMGFRDFIDFVERIDIRFNFGDGLKYMTKVNPIHESGRRIIEDMRARGKFNQLHHYEFAVPGELAAMRAGTKIQKTAADIAEAGLKASLQPQLHEVAQAATYIMMQDKVAPMLNKLIQSGDHTLPLVKGNAKWKGYAKSKVFTFTDNNIAHFDNLVKQGLTEKATDFISTIASHEVAYDYGAGNGPYESRRPFMRVGLQFGTWSMNTRSYMMRAFSRGTLKDRYSAAAKFALYEAAKFNVGLSTGLNMSRFYLIPGIFWQGGPFFQYAQYAANIMSGSQWDQDRSAWAFVQLLPNFGRGDMRSLLLPGSYAMYDYMQAARMFADGDNIFEVTGRGLGVPVQRDRPNWYEMYVPGAGAVREAFERR